MNNQFGRIFFSFWGQFFATIFSDSITLDPQIWSCVREANLADLVSKLSGGLDAQGPILQNSVLAKITFPTNFCIF
jgi:hypothetical protein